MPLCPQITNTPITVTQTADFTVSSVLPVVPANTEQLAEVEVIANGKNKIYRQTTAPTGTLTVGDVWFDTDDGNKQYYWTGTAWVSVQDNAIATAQATADSKIKTFYQTTAPTATGAGDVWFDTDDGNKQYRWSGSAWVSVQDTAIAAATSAAASASAAAAAASAAAASASAAASAAQTTADGKNKIYRQTSAPTGTLVSGDLWFDTDDDNKIYRYDGSAWVANTLGNNALASISANKITAGTIDASVITVSNINAGNISTGTLAADRIAAASITGAKIAAGTITAANITAGTITSAEIATGTITASDIATGTITASQIASGTITGSLIAAGTITATNIAANTITASQIAAATITASNLAAGTLSASNITTGTLSASVGLTAQTGTIGGFTITPTYLGGSGGFTLYSNGTIDGGNANTLFYGYVNVGGGSPTGDRFQVSGTSNFNGTLTGLDIRANGDLFAAGHSTTTNTPQAYVFQTGGRIARSTSSSERYKENIVDLSQVPELDPKKLLDLPVRAFTYKEGELPETDDRHQQLIPGFIAEEVDAIYPVAADYVDGPESWNDRMIVPALLSLVQDLYKEVQTLKGE